MKKKKKKRRKKKNQLSFEINTKEKDLFEVASRKLLIAGCGFSSAIIQESKSIYNVFGYWIEILGGRPNKAALGHTLKNKK